MANTCVAVLVWGWSVALLTHRL